MQPGNDPQPDVGAWARGDAAPLLFRPDGHSLALGGLYAGRACFLLCGGPSLLDQDLAPLAERGLLTCSVNNAATVFRTNLWVGIDGPHKFADAIWKDPAIGKFVPFSHVDKTIRERDAAGQLCETFHAVRALPNVLAFRRNYEFCAESFFTERSVNCGNLDSRSDADGNTGGRSVMLAAIKLLFYLGVRRVYLLGCDFSMRYGQQNYAFDQARTREAVAGNNRTYRVLQARFSRLIPVMEGLGFSIVNCTPGGGLHVFPRMALAEAIEEILSAFPGSIQTEGMYEPRESAASENPHSNP